MQISTDNMGRSRASPFGYVFPAFERTKGDEVVHAATIRAALAYRREEMTCHGSDAMRPYFDVGVEPLDPAETKALQRQFTRQQVRFLRISESANALSGPIPCGDLLLHPSDDCCAVVLLPLRE
jgi:hypothetical protein